MDGCGRQRRPLAPGSSRLDRAIIGWMEYVVIALSFGLATAIIGKAKGSSFFIWLAVGTVLPLLGLIAVVLYRSEKTEPERRCPRCGAVHKLYIQVCHEQGGGHAAEGYAKASGNVGVALATSGPGATNMVTAIADAIMDSVPTVFLTGQVRTELIGTDGFQEADVTGITMPIVKHSLMIQDPRDIPKAIHEAFHVASSGRPGPVLVDVPQDLSRADIPYEPVTKVHLPGYQPTTEGNTKQIRLAAKALANSRRPVIYGGGGVVNADAAAEFRDLCTADRFPVTLTVMGLGAFPADHEQWLGMLGMHGTRTANYAMDEADLIVAVGARFDDRVTGKLSEFAPRAKFIHIHIDPPEIPKNVPAHTP